MRAIYAAAFAALATQPFAAVAFDNFSPVDTFSPSVGWTVSGTSGANGPQRVAFQFTSAATGMLDTITIALGHVQGDPHLEFRLTSDGGNAVGLTGLRAHGISFPNFADGLYTPLTVTNPFTDPVLFPQLVLQAGQKYWIEALPYEHDSDTWGAWNYASTGSTGLMGVSLDGGVTRNYLPNNTMGAFRVTVDETGVPAVPEPATIALAGLALAAAARRRKRA